MVPNYFWVLRNHHTIRMTKFPFDIMLEDIRSALNVGAIFRTCDAAGVRKLFLSGITPYPPHNRIPKTALGAIDMVSWEYHRHPLILAQQLKTKGAHLVGVEQTPTSKDFHTVDYPENTILIFGNEITGVSPELLAMTDLTVQLPMFGSKESLNVATTVGIMAYHLAIRNYNPV